MRPLHPLKALVSPQGCGEPESQNHHKGLSVDLQGWPTVPVHVGLRVFLGCQTFHANTRTVLGKLGWLVTLDQWFSTWGDLISQVGFPDKIQDALLLLNFK